MTIPSTQNSSVAQFEHEYIQGRSLWYDAWRRLLRNRAAVLGMIVITLNILAAIFAGAITKRDYATQAIDTNNVTPLWLVNFFPSMTPKSLEVYDITRSWPLVEGLQTGDRVSIGDPLFENNIGNTRDAASDGTVIIDTAARKVYLIFDEESRFAVLPGWQVNVQSGQQVRAGTVLMTEIEGSGQEVAQRDGVVYFSAASNELLLQAGSVVVSDEYLLGADSVGRDLFSRLLYGGRVSLLVALIGPLVSICIGLPVGLISGYLGGWIDGFLMRLVDIMFAFPNILLIILLMAFFRTSFGGSDTESGALTSLLSSADRKTGGMLFIFVGIGITSWMQLARLTRGQILSLRETEFIVAARAVGAKTPRIMGRHILPNILGPIIVAETLTIPNYIRTEAFLSFIGLGVNPPTPSWGAMINDGRGVLVSYPHQALFPALMLFLIMFAFNFLGDGLRDALDPRMRGVD